MTRRRGTGEWWFPPRVVFPLSLVIGALGIALFVSRHYEAISVVEIFTIAPGIWMKSWGGPGRFAAACVGHAKALATVAGLLVVARIAGPLPLAWLGAEGGLGAAAIGLGTLALGILALALDGVLARSPLALLGALAVVAGMITRSRGRRKEGGGIRWPAPVAGLLGLLLGTDAIACLCPEWFLDGRMYHLALPERFLLTGKFPVLEGHLLTFLPLNTEMLYTAAMAFGGEEGAKLLNFAAGLLLLGAVAGLAGRLAGPRTRAPWIAALLVATFPLTMVENEIAFSDNLRALFETLALVAALDVLARRRGALAVGAVFAGLAMGTKYLSVIRGGLLAAGFLALAGYGAWRVRRGRALRFVALASVVVAPWLARNWLAGRDPVYPFGIRWFDSLGYSAGELAAWMADNRHYGVAAQTPARWLTLPFRVALEPVGGEFGTFTPGPLMLGLGVLFLARRRFPPAVAMVAGIAVVEALVWSGTSELIRYLLPGLVAAATVGAWFLAEVEVTRPRVARVWLALIAVWSGCGLVMRIHHRYNLSDLYAAGGYVLGKYDAATANVARGYGDPLAALPSGPVLLVGETQPLGIGRPWVGCTVYNRMGLHRWAAESRDAGRFAVKVRQSGVRSIILNVPDFRDWSARGAVFTMTPRELAILNPWWKSLRKSASSGPRFYYPLPR